MRKVKPLNDFIFKKVFGEKGNEDILISFINAVLKRTKKEKIVELEIIDNKQLTKELILDKTGIIDVRAKTSNGENIDIERWLMFLEKDISETTLKELISLDTAIEKAEQKIEYLSSDEEAMRIYYERERLLHERANMISSAEARGVEKGKLEIAKNLLDMKISIEQIVLATGLTEEELSLIHI